MKNRAEKMSAFDSGQSTENRSIENDLNGVTENTGIEISASRKSNAIDSEGKSKKTSAEKDKEFSGCDTIKEDEEDNGSIIDDYRLRLSGINRQFKDSAFTCVYNDPVTASELVNDLLGTNYTPEDIEIVTLAKDNQMIPHNDVGILSKDYLIVLTEEQSSKCPNMPLRMLFYLTQSYIDFLKNKEPGSKYNRNRFVKSSVLVGIPTPVLFVVSTVEQDNSVMKLSDAFRNKSVAGNVEVTVPVIYSTDQRAKNALVPYFALVACSNEIKKEQKERNISDEEILRRLREAVINSKGSATVINKMLEKEGEIMGVMFDEVTFEELREIEAEAALERANKLIEKQKEAFEKQKEAFEEQKEALEEQKEAFEESERNTVISIRNLKLRGFEFDEIASILNISVDQLNDLLIKYPDI